MAGTNKQCKICKQGGQSNERKGRKPRGVKPVKGSSKDLAVCLGTRGGRGKFLRRGKEDLKRRAEGESHPDGGAHKQALLENSGELLERCPVKLLRKKGVKENQGRKKHMMNKKNRTYHGNAQLGETSANRDPLGARGNVQKKAKSTKKSY